MPEEISERFKILAQSVGTIERSLGRVMDEWITELPKGYHEQAFEMFSDLYRSATGQYRTPRTMRSWRTAAITYKRHELETFHALSDSQLVAAVELAEIRQDGATAQDIAQWAVDKGVSSVPAMREQWGTITSTGDEIDPGWLTGIKRTAKRYLSPDDPRWKRVNEIFSELRELFR